MPAISERRMISTVGWGSTGTPVTILDTVFNACVSKGLMLRYALWHKLDLKGKLCVIKLAPASRISATATSATTIT